MGFLNDFDIKYARLLVRDLGVQRALNAQFGHAKSKRLISLLLNGSTLGAEEDELLDALMDILDNGKIYSRFSAKGESLTVS